MAWVARGAYHVLNGTPVHAVALFRWEASYQTGWPWKVVMEKVWGLDVIVGDRTIDVHIRKLREKFGDDYIKTIKGVGYKFVCK